MKKGISCDLVQYKVASAHKIQTICEHFVCWRSSISERWDLCCVKLCIGLKYLKSLLKSRTLKPTCSSQWVEEPDYCYLLHILHERKSAQLPRTKKHKSRHNFHLVILKVEVWTQRSIWRGDVNRHCWQRKTKGHWEVPLH